MLKTKVLFMTQQQPQHQPQSAAFSGLIDLAQERLGGKTLSCSDDFFAEKENLLKPGRGIFIADKFTDRGKWMDGWESRRKRTEGYDWCVIKLGLSGIVRGVDIDTNHFLGNHPPYASVEACCIGDDENPEIAEWAEVLEKSPLNAGSQNLFSINSNQRWTHLRLNIYPDGGVARFRVYGDVVPDWGRVKPDETIDLASVTMGAKVVAASDMFFGPKDNLIMPGPSLNMGDGWETKRRRTPGFDWVVVELGSAGKLSQIELDTSHFKGNYPDSASIEGCFAPNTKVDSLAVPNIQWTELLPQQKLQAHHRHFYEKEISNSGPFTHIKLNIFPDGGVARLRVFGQRVILETEKSKAHEHSKGC